MLHVKLTIVGAMVLENKKCPEGPSLLKLTTGNNLDTRKNQSKSCIGHAFS